MIAPDTLHVIDYLELMRALPDSSVDMVLTDPPYNEVNRDSNGLRLLDKGIADSGQWDLSAFVYQCCRVTKGWCVVFCGIEQVSMIRTAFNADGMNIRLLIWKKTNPSPLNCEHTFLSDIECCLVGRKAGATFNGFYQSSVFEFPTQQNQIHPTQKPLDLFRRLIRLCSNVGDVVLDPFCGSGTTAVAAHHEQRHYICGDISAEYIDIARKRVNPTFGEPPKRVKDVLPLTDLPLFGGLD